MDSSATWVMMGPNKSLGYLLYERGYDVWLGNVRGNSYARKHKVYNTEQEEFWDFSFHEMGIYDVPNTIDYILGTTDSRRLHYVGHSQGSMAFWVMGSERPEYMRKIISMQALAPLAFFNHVKSPLISFHDHIQYQTNLWFILSGSKEFLPDNKLIDRLSKQLCRGSSLSKRICSNLLFINVGYNRDQVNETMLPVINGHVPAGTSTKLIQHLSQIRGSGSFSEFDYGSANNLLRYKKKLPPKYYLANVNVGVSLYYSQNDWLAQPEDVQHLRRELKNVLVDHQIISNFSNMDFVWGIDAPNLSGTT